MGLILSVDVGTTNIKAGVIDKHGRIFHFAREPIEMEQPECGASEHNPHKLFTQLIKICRKVSRYHRKDISLMAMSSYQFGLIHLDKNSLPLSGLITFLDSRAQDTIHEFRKEMNYKFLYRHTGCPPLFQYTLSRIYYSKTKKPLLFKKTRFFLSSKDYLIFLLTGQMITEPSIASATQMMNIYTRKWDKEVLQKIDVLPEQLAEIVEGNKEAIPLKKKIIDSIGLNASVKLIPGVYDGGALAIGVGGLKENTAVSNIGTSGMLRAVCSKPVFDKEDLMRFQLCYLLNGKYLVGGAINNATIPLRWLAKILNDKKIYSSVNKSCLGANHLFFLPYLTGERDHKIGNYASGVFFGLKDHHTRYDILQSALEGVGYSLRFIKDALVENDIQIREIRMGGGGSQNLQWVKIFSDILNTPIGLTRSEEDSLIGNGIMGHCFLGEYSSLQEGVDRVVKKKMTIKPNFSRVKQYHPLYDFYKKLYFGLEELFIQHSSLIRENSKM